MLVIQLLLMTTSIVLDIVGDVIQLNGFHVYIEDPLQSIPPTPVSAIVTSSIQSVASMMTVSASS